MSSLQNNFSWSKGAGLLVLVLLGLFVLATIFSLSSSGGGCVGLVSVRGEIVSEKTFLDDSFSSQEFSSILGEASSSPEVASLLLVINSPGGSAVASKEAFDALREFDKPSVAFLDEVAASGGYYIASASDYVVSHPNSITGSIGARASFLNYEELFKKIGLAEQSIKSGEKKDIGAGYREMTAEEEKILSSIVNESFENFKQDVIQARGERVLNNAFFEEALDGRLLSATQAFKAGLADEVGSREQALLKAAKEGGLSFEGGELPEVCDLTPEQGFKLIDFARIFGESIGAGFAKAALTDSNQVSVGYR